MKLDTVSGYIRIPTLKTVDRFLEELRSHSIPIPCEPEWLPVSRSPISQPSELFGRKLCNRFAIQPMEGWDADAFGAPTEHTYRRWRHYGASGASVIWGGEAVAVREDGRATSRQLLLSKATQTGIAGLLECLKKERKRIASDDNVVIGLQLTHSGRFSHPHGANHDPVILYHHPILDPKFNIPGDYPVMSDGEIRRLEEDFVEAAILAYEIGFDFVDIKHCHGYLGHEFLSAKTRDGQYGGSLENRTRFLKNVTEGVCANAPGLGIGVRCSVFDVIPYRPDPETSLPGKPGKGVPEEYSNGDYHRWAFGSDHVHPTEPDLSEAMELFDIFRKLSICLVNVTAGSPYYNPHIQRPALYPPSDGYLPPEDPLWGVFRQMNAVRELKRCFPDIVMIGSALTYLQDFLPNVAQAALREGWMDFVGIGRMVLAYPSYVRDLLEGKPLDRKKICRTFSDCTTAPRNGFPSGCYPLDPYYKKSSMAKDLAQIKKGSSAN